MGVMVRGARLQGPQQWEKVSKEVAEVLLPLLATQQMNLHSCDAVSAVLTVLCSLCPSVFSPPDCLLKALLTSPPCLQSSHSVAVWVASVTIVMRLVMSRCSADVVLTRLSQLGLTMEYVPADPTPQHSPLQQHSPPPTHTGNIFTTSANFSPMRRKLVTQMKSCLADQCIRSSSPISKDTQEDGATGIDGTAKCITPQPTTTDPLNVCQPPVAPDTAIARCVTDA